MKPKSLDAPKPVRAKLTQPPPAQKAPAVEPAASPPKKAGESEFSNGRGSALRAQALATTGATSLRTEVLGDGSANCVERAVRLAQAGDRVMLLRDAVDGVGHAVVVHADGRVVDPNEPSTPFASIDEHLAAHPRYRQGATVENATLERVLSVPPGAQRDRLLQQAGLSGVANALLADGQTRWVMNGTNLRRADGSVVRVLSGQQATVLRAATAAEDAALDAAARGRYSWLQLRLPDGSVGFVAESRTTATAPATPAPTPTPGTGRTGVGRGGHFLNGNYTDLGMQNGWWNEAAAAHDLARLKAVGVTNVRVWAPAAGIDGNAADAMANRVDALARLAAAQGMTLTVDLYDGATNQRLQNYLDAEPLIRNRIQTIVGRNAGHSNIIWSLGNEMQAPDRPREFGDWYAKMVGEMRRAGARAVSAELVPGAAGNVPSNPDVAYAMQRIASSVDVVSIHMYPNAPIEAVGPYGESYGLFRTWLDLGNRLGRTVYVGEFGLEGHAHSPQNLDHWLRHLQDLGVNKVFLWQFMKDEAGHVDGLSFDSLRGRSWEGDLRAAGWIN